MNKRIVAFDTETFYDAQCSVKTLGNWAYCNHPDFECYLISVYDGKESWAGHPKDFDSKKWLEGNVVLSHNAGFDMNVYMRLVNDGIVKPVDIPEWHCTADLAVYICGLRNLKDAAKEILGEKISKAERGKAEGKRYADFVALGPDAWKAICDYAIGDVLMCWRIWKECAAEWPAHEMELSDYNIGSAIHGVRINWDLHAEYEAQVGNAQQAVLNKLPWAGKGPATSPDLIKEACFAIGIAPPPVRSKDEEAYQQWLDDNRDKAPWIEAISQYRKLMKMAAFLQTMKARRRRDDCIDAQLLYYGAHTGRFSGALGFDSGGINLQNLRKDALVLPNGFEVYQRHLFVPRPGHKFVIADYAQIEARVINWAAGNTELLRMLEEHGMSIYEAHARTTMGWTGGELKKEDPKTYALAKARVLMLGYGAGWEKFQSTAFKMLGLNLSHKEAYQTVAEFRASNPEIQALWWGFSKELEEASKWVDNKSPEGLLQNFLEIELPSGRAVRYMDVKSTLRTRNITEVVWDAAGEIVELKKKSKLVSELTARTGNRPSRAYGGLVTENLTQAIARDIFVEGLLALLRHGWAVPIHVHDEVVVEVPKEVTVREVVDVMMSAKPSWAEGCPIDVEAGEYDRYLKD